jgi:hypothetical protein
LTSGENWQTQWQVSNRVSVKIALLGLLPNDRLIIGSTPIWSTKIKFSIIKNFINFTL